MAVFQDEATLGADSMERDDRAGGVAEERKVEPEVVLD